MKNKFLTFTFFITSIITLSAEQIPVSTLQKALNVTELDKTVGCALLSTAGGLLSVLNESDKARACVVCGDAWARDPKSKAMLVACGASGSPTEKQKAYLTKAVENVVQSDKNCENLALLHDHFDLLSPEQRLKGATACFGTWKNHPKARKAIINKDDYNDAQEQHGTLPTFDEVVQLQTLAKSDQAGQFTTEITQEQYTAATKK